jgi:hypothetical protein
LNKKNIPFIIFILMMVLVGLSFRIIVSSPNWLHYDENYYLNITQNYVDRGELTPYMWRLGDANIITGGGSGYGILVLIEWLRLFDYSLFWGRMLMVLAGLVTAGVMYKVSRLWWQNPKAGWASFVFSIVSTSAFYTLVLRMDAIGILVYSLILLIHIIAVRLNIKWLHFILGIVSVISLEFHVLGVLYLIALSIYYFMDLVREILSMKHPLRQTSALYFGLGALLASILYASIHILPDPRAYFVISNNCFECNESLFLTEIKRISRLLLLRPLEVLIFILVIIAAFIRRRQPDIHYLQITGGWVLAQAVVGTPPYTHYTNHGWILVALGVGGFVSEGFKSRVSKWRMPISVAIAIILLLFNLGMHFADFHPYLLAYTPEDDQTIEYITQKIPKDTVIMGKVPSFYPLRDYRNYVSYRDGTEYGIEFRNEDMLDFWRRISPQVIVLDESDVRKDNELLTYLEEYEFTQLFGNLWITQDQPGLSILK